MIDSRYREYFKVLATFHRLNPSQRPQALAGFILTTAKHHDDPFTRSLLQRFHDKERPRYAAQSA